MFLNTRNTIKIHQQKHKQKHLTYTGLARWNYIIYYGSFVCVCVCAHKFFTVYKFVFCLDYCPCLIWGRASSGPWKTRGSSCRCGASLSGFVLVPFSSENAAAGEERESVEWVHVKPTQTCESVCNLFTTVNQQLGSCVFHQNTEWKHTWMASAGPTVTVLVEET